MSATYVNFGWRRALCGEGESWGEGGGNEQVRHDSLVLVAGSTQQNGWG